MKKKLAILSQAFAHLFTHTILLPCGGPSTENMCLRAYVMGLCIVLINVVHYGWYRGLLTYLIFDVDITAEINEVLSNFHVIFHHSMYQSMVQGCFPLLHKTWKRKKRQRR